MNLQREFTRHPHYEKLGKHIAARLKECQDDALKSLRNGDDNRARINAGRADAFAEIAAHMEKLWDDAKSE